MVGRCPEKPFVVRVAADDSVENNDVGQLDSVGICCDVMDAPICSLIDPRFAKKLHRLALVSCRELEVERTGSTQLQELDLNLADSTTDLKDARLVDALLLEERDQPPSSLVQSALSIALRRSMRDSFGEEAVTTA